MNPSLVSTIITVAFFAFVSLGFLFGYLKGAMKSMVDLVVALTCTILSVPITKLIVNIALTPASINRILSRVSVSSPESVETIEAAKELLVNEGTKDSASDLVRLVAALPVMIITPIIYMLVFATFAFFLYILAIFVKKVACKPTENTKKVPFRFLGAGLGAIAFGTLFAMFFTPVWGYSNLATTVIEQCEATADEDLYEEIVQVKDYTSTIDGNVVPAVSYNLGGRLMFNTMTSFKVDKTKINLQDEISSVIDIAAASNTLSSTDVKNYGPNEIEAINQINASLEKSEYFPLLISKTVSFVSNEYSQGNAVLGVSKPNLGDRFNPTFDRVLNVTKNTTSDDFRNDVKMVSDIIVVGINKGAFQNGLDAWTLLGNSAFLSSAFVKLNANPRTTNTVPYLADAITNYTYERYNAINGTDKKPEPSNYQKLTEEQLVMEANKIAEMTSKLHTFTTSTSFEDGMEYKTVINEADFTSLAQSLEMMRSSIYTNRMFTIVFHAFLRSEAADDTGLVDDAFYNAATKPDSDLVYLFSSRQNVLKLAVAIQEKKGKEERTELMHTVVEDILMNNAGEASTSSFISKDNLLSMGMTEFEADSIDAIVNSMVSGANQCTFADDKEKEIEVQKTEAIIDAISNTVLVENNDQMFKTNTDDASTSDMTARDFVDQVLDSKLSSEMVVSATKDKDGNTLEDPYNINNSLSDSDRVEIEKALNESYASSELTEEEAKVLDSLSIIFCVGSK